MKTIWKFQLTEGVQQKVSVPRGAETLHIDAQETYPHMEGDRAYALTLWAMVDTMAVVDEVLPEDFKWLYLGTALMPSGLVWHVFREP